MPFYRCVECGDIRWIDNDGRDHGFFCNQCGGDRKPMPKDESTATHSPSQATQVVVNAIMEAINFGAIEEVDGMHAVGISLSLKEAHAFLREHGRSLPRI
jgi:DNA-directed RNA polymerase subunit RPC12/RpoP